MRVKLLIVDDEIVQLNLIGKVISRYRPEYEITTTHQPEQALRYLADGTYDAGLTDIRMPGMDGIELIRRIRAMKSDPLEVMILSGYDDFQYAKTAITYNVLEYLLKPIDSTSLENALTKLEAKLIENRSFQHIQDGYRAMEKQRTTTALFKMTSNLELNVQESACIEELKGAQIRLVYLENCEKEVCERILSREDHAESLSENRYLVFRVASDEKVDRTMPPREGYMVVSLPCRIEELTLRWKQTEDYADTCRRMGRHLIVQRSCNTQILQALVENIAQQNAEGVLAMTAPLAGCLRNGELTLSNICHTVKNAVAGLRQTGATFGVYPNRLDEFWQMFEERLAACSSAAQFCDAVGQLLANRKEETEEDSFARNVEIYLGVHFAEECSLDHIARIFGYSSAHFSRLFTAAFGIPYTRYLAEYRLERASELLKSMDLPVSEIARRVGIADPGYFTRQFSKKYQTSPAKYRKIFGDGCEK